MKKGLFLCLTAALMFGWTAIGGTQPSKVPAEVWQKAQTNGVVGIIVELDVPFTPEAVLNQQALFAQRQAIAAAQDALLASLAGTKYKVIGRARFTPGIGLDVGVDALAVLERSPLVKRVTESGVLKLEGTSP